MIARTRLVTAAVGALVLVVGGSARAEESKRVAVLGTGPEGAAAASGAASHLSAPYTTADSGAFRGALGAAGMRLLPVAAKRRDKDADFVARARAAARASHVDEAIVVHGEKSKKAMIFHVWVIDAQGSGSAQVDEDVKLAAGASAGDGADGVWGAVASSFPAKTLEPTSTPSAAPAEGEAKSAARAEARAEEEAPAKPAEQEAGTSNGPAPAASDRTRATALAVLEASMLGGSRHFSYVDRLTPTLRPYDLTAAPMLAIHGEIYPFVSTKTPVLSGLGASGRFARAIGIGSEDSAGNKVGTSWQAFDLGLRERLLLGPSFILGVDVGYADNDFAFDNPVTTNAQLPSIHYKILRAGLDGRVVRDKLSVYAAASYLDVMSTGDFDKLFPRTSVAGIDAGLGISYVIAPSVELSLDLDYQRFFYALKPQPGDLRVAGGALDQMVTLSLGIAYLF